jgi:predicted RNA-binding Zn-ribbon protein involved in translation (DUF1610 family)
MGNVTNLSGMNGQAVNINIDSLPAFVCPECLADTFSPIFKIKALSRITSPKGKPGSLHHQVGFICTGCGRQMDVQEIANSCREMVEGVVEPTMGPNHEG